MVQIKDGQRRYGCWAGRPNGNPEDPTRCIEGVMTKERFSMEHQCNRKRGFGPDGLYCKQHDPDVVKRREEENARRQKEKWDREMAPHHQRNDFAEALKQIAEGHNDPRSLARQVLAKWNVRTAADDAMDAIAEHDRKLGIPYGQG